MHVFQCHRPVELTVLDVQFYGLESVDDELAFLRGEHAYPGQHAGMGDGAGNILLVHAAVKTHGGGKGLDKGIRWLVEPAGPGFAA